MNFNFANYELNEFDAAYVINNLESIISLQKVHITAVYLETNILDSQNAVGVVNNGQFDDGYSQYTINISSINRTFNVDVAVQSMNDNNYKSDFYHLSVQLGNVISNIDNSLDNFNTVRKEIKYVDKKQSTNLTSYEHFCVDVVDNHKNLTNELTAKISAVLTRIGV